MLFFNQIKIIKKLVGWLVFLGLQMEPCFFGGLDGVVDPTLGCGRALKTVELVV